MITFKPLENFVYGVSDPYVMVSEATFKITSDADWQYNEATESHFQLDKTSGTAGETIVTINSTDIDYNETIEFSSGSDILQVQITASEIVSIAPDTVSKTASSSAGAITFSGTIINPVYDQNGDLYDQITVSNFSDSWILSSSTSTGQVDNDLSYEITLQIPENTGTERSLTFDIGYKNLVSEQLSLTQETAGAKLTVEPTTKVIESSSVTDSITVTYTGTGTLSWESDVVWLTLGSSIVSNKLSFTATKNRGEQRTGKITITDGNLTATTTIIQQAGESGTLYLSPQALTTDYQAKTESFNIVYTGSDSLTASTTESWFSVGISGNTVRAIIQENTGSERTGYFTVTDGNLSTQGAIRQEAKPAADTITLTPSEITLDSTAQSKIINISYTGIKSLSASSNQSWLSVGTISNNRFSYSVTQNTGTSRVGIITVSDGSVSSTATITQSSPDKGTIRVSSTSQSVSATGGIITNTITTSGSTGVISVSSNSSWCSVSLSGTTITANCSTNSGSSRTATITVSATNADSVKYTITQAAVEQSFIYFESESKSIGYQGGTISNTLYTSGTTPSYSSTQSWASVSSSGIVTVSSNSSSSSRSATITASNSVGSASYTIYQTGYSTSIPIWKNTIYSESTSSDYIEYHIDSSSGTVLYAGKIYKYPNSSSVEFLVNDVISNYLTVMPFPSSNGNTSYNTWKQSFNLVTSTGKSTSYTFYNDWSYDESIQQIDPISKIVDPRQLFVCSGENTYFMIGSTRYSVNGTYRLDLSSLLLPCGTEIKVYNNSSLIWTYIVDDSKKNYVIYWANKYGGWDFLPIAGNSLRTDNITSNKYSRMRSYSLYDVKYQNTVKPSWKLYSGWIKGNLSDLISSVDVKLYDLDNKKLYDVLITDSQAEWRNYKNNGNHLVSYEINCEMSNDFIRR